MKVGELVHVSGVVRVLMENTIICEICNNYLIDNAEILLVRFAGWTKNPHGFQMCRNSFHTLTQWLEKYFVDLKITYHISDEIKVMF